jgi:hypothetical protein
MHCEKEKSGERNVHSAVKGRSNIVMMGEATNTEHQTPNSLLKLRANIRLDKRADGSHQAAQLSFLGKVMSQQSKRKE